MMDSIASASIFAAFTVALLAAAIAAFSDFRGMKIANALPLTITAAFVAAWLIDLAVLSEQEIFGAWWSAPLAGFLMLVLGFLLFSTGVIGGGDAKLVPALALWTGLGGLPVFLLYMSLAGALLAVLALVGRGSKAAKKLAGLCGEKSWPAVLAEGKSALPYGIAIFTGALGAFLHTGIAAAVFPALH